MYFQKFPYTFYTLDDRKTTQLIQNILIRNKITDDIKNSFVMYDEYDVRDGDTPEILAYKFYGDSNLHWLVLQMNEILDPRFDWPLDTRKFQDYLNSKYHDIDGIDHYEDSNENQINGNVILNASIFNNFNVGDVVYNLSSKGIGYITSSSSTSIIVTTTEGGFKAGNLISNNIMGTSQATITSTTSITGTPVTFYIAEDRANEAKRRVRILKPQFVSAIIAEFDRKIAE
jgi:hypothetical protein